MKVRRALKGFSLVELIIVIAILAILTVIGLQIFSGTNETAKHTVAESNARLLSSQLNNYAAMLPLHPGQTALNGNVDHDVSLLKSNSVGVGDVLYFKDAFDESNAKANITWNSNGGYYLVVDLSDLTY